MYTAAQRQAALRGSPLRNPNHKEQLQVAWLSGVAASAGCNMTNFVYDDGVDVHVRHKHPAHKTANNTAMLDVQLKATTLPPTGSSIKIKIKRKRLREYAVSNPTLPIIVVGMVLPSQQADWVRRTDFCLALRGRCAWRNFEGYQVPAGDEDAYVSVTIPLANPFDDVALSDIMAVIGQGGRP